MTIGTSNFVNLSFARRYYASQEVSMAEVNRKIQDKSIIIGPPEIKLGEKLKVNWSEGRYLIQYP